MIDRLGIIPKSNEKGLSGKLFMKAVFQKWIPTADVLLEMIMLKLSSSVKAQAYKASHLYEGPIDDPNVIAIQKCDQDDPLAILISKMIPTNDKDLHFWS